MNEWHFMELKKKINSFLLPPKSKHILLFFFLLFQHIINLNQLKINETHILLRITDNQIKPIYTTFTVLIKKHLRKFFIKSLIKKYIENYPSK